MYVQRYVANTPDRGEGEGEGSGPSRDQFPPSVLRACSLLRAGGNNTPQPANFICCHFLIFSLSLSLPETQQCATLTSHSAPLHACEAEIGCSGLSKVSKLSPLPRMFFPLPLFFICHVLRAKNTPDILVFFSFFFFFSFFSVACGIQQFQVGSREERARRKDKSTETGCI